MSRPVPDTKDSYHSFLTIPTRWADNDVYGHINNAVYYFYFDTAVNRFLIDNGWLEIGKSEIIGLVVNTGCSYFAPMRFPDEITAGLRVAKLGRSSVTYEIGLFKNDETRAAAQGHFVHVYVDEASRNPVEIPHAFKDALTKILKQGE